MNCSAFAVAESFQEFFSPFLAIQLTLRAKFC